MENCFSKFQRLFTRYLSLKNLKINSKTEERINVCQGCSMFTGVRCLHYGCETNYFNILVKGNCPEGKWSCQQ